MTQERSLLAGRWLVEDIGGAGILDGAAPTLDFGADGSVAGSTGLNRIRGRYDVIDGRLHMSTLVSTRMAGPPAAMRQEQRLIEALEASGPIVEDDPFVNIGDGKTSLRLIRGDEPDAARSATGR